ncbi:hypothetical protein OAH87_01260 [Marinomonas sp.]|nr:hypothetical protein [Marinomonas sp.]MDB4837083.1 hypothetical protein [Marinomonas sp.]
MNNLYLGASIDTAQCVFLLPNKPILPINESGQRYVTDDVSLLISLNGNHWRKIFTIMAKLTTPSFDDWRLFRDRELLNTVRVVFSIDQLTNYSGLIYLVGNIYRDHFPIPLQADLVGEKHHGYVELPYVWCPYLDYRQFPNLLIKALRKRILEESCLHH